MLLVDGPGRCGEGERHVGQVTGGIIVAHPDSPFDDALLDRLPLAFADRPKRQLNI
jgi:hypothetical protein